MSKNFLDTVELMGLTPKCVVVYDGEGIFITEEWVEASGHVMAERLYYFDLLYIDVVPTELHAQVLRDCITIYIEQEEYEQAAVARDMLAEIVDR